MNKQEEEQKVFDMAKQDILFLKNLELIEHNDRPDFILKDKNDRKIGLEHFRTDIYRVQDKNSSNISGGHTILNNSKKELFQKYHPLAVNNTWNDESTEQAAGELFGHIEDSLNMQIHYKYEDFLDNIRVGIHGRLPKVKGHIQKSKNYPDREHYDLMGFLIEIPVPSFQYYFETVSSQQISRIKSLLHPLNLQEIGKILRRYNKGYSYQKINGLPITNEIWKEINTFENIDFIMVACSVMMTVLQFDLPINVSSFTKINREIWLLTLSEKADLSMSCIGQRPETIHMRCLMDSNGRFLLLSMLIRIFRSRSMEMTSFSITLQRRNVIRSLITN